tara:strand:+ start:1340 stop:1789 length:450 start_codon:yes stop_codon:yes gene_type:complete
MENEDTEYIDGYGDDFTTFLFSKKPRGKNTIKLELDPPKQGVQLGLHIFQELLMIFTLGMKFCYKNNSGELNISQIKEEELEEINQHFQSFGFTLLVESFTIHDYLSNMKTPNYFKDKHLIKETTLLRDIYYESVIEGYIYRITFDFLQ